MPVDGMFCLLRGSEVLSVGVLILLLLWLLLLLLSRPSVDGDDAPIEKRPAALVVAIGSSPVGGAEEILLRAVVSFEI